MSFPGPGFPGQGYKLGSRGEEGGGGEQKRPTAGNSGQKQGDNNNSGHRARENDNYGSNKRGHREKFAGQKRGSGERDNSGQRRGERDNSGQKRGNFGGQRGSRDNFSSSRDSSSSSRNNQTISNSNVVANQPQPNQNNTSNSKPDNNGAKRVKNNRENNDPYSFNFTRIIGFLNKPNEEVLNTIGRNKKEWEERLSDLRSLHGGYEFLVLIIELLATVVCADTPLKIVQNQVLQSSLSEKFRAQISMMLNELIFEPTKDATRKQANGIEINQKPMKIMKDLYTIFSFLFMRMPETGLDILKNMIPLTMSAMNSLKESNTNPTESNQIDKLMNDFTQLRDQIKAALEKKAKREELMSNPIRNRNEFTPEQEKEMDKLDPEEDFREISIIPSKEELFSKIHPFLRPNKKSGAYNDPNHYLDVQFRLLREDFLYPLKEGIRTFKKDKNEYLGRKKRMPLGDVRLYHPVKINDYKIEFSRTIYWLQLPAHNYKKIKWDRTKRLLNGSLLLLTYDDFQTCFFAVIANRDLKKLANGIIGVTFEGQPPSIERFRDDYIVLECEVYFEAYRHNLKALQTIKLDNFPMTKFIVYASNEVGAPRYLLDTENIGVGNGIQLYEKSSFINPLVLNDWPSKVNLCLDESQYNAFQAALTKEFAIIQGPPGSGKTYLGLRIVDVLLRNKNIWNLEHQFEDPRGREGNAGLILVVCYTNHALDQFLEGSIKLLEDFKIDLDSALTRVGGMCKTEKIDRFSLMNKRKIARMNRSYSFTYLNAMRDAHRKIDDILDKRGVFLRDYTALENPEGIINFENLIIWNEIKDEYDPRMLNFLKYPGWFGFNNNFFSANNFSEDAIIENWFPKRNNLTDMMSMLNMNQGAESSNNNKGNLNTNNDDVESLEDGEDYDLDEIQGTRIIEEDIGEDEFLNLYGHQKEKRENDIKSYIFYVNEMSVSEGRRLINSYEFEINKLERDQQAAINKFGGAAGYRQKLQEYRARIAGERNKIRFFEKLFQKIHRNEIQFPTSEEISNIIEINNIKAWVNFYTISIDIRYAIYMELVKKARQFIGRKITKLNLELAEAQNALEQAKMMGDIQILRKSLIVGMTTTGAAKYNEMLRMINAKIVIVEEAAEVLESHIVTCISKSCEHLILIGDHQQLRPNPTVYFLAKKYNLDISLFERMLNNDLNCYKLKVQHRMRPEIANLIVGTIYKNLENNRNVYDYPPVLGVTKNLFFISHKEKEKDDADSLSKSNEHEANFIASLCRYLVLQGYDPSRITVLTTYMGQMFLLKNKIRDFSVCFGIRVTCVDNYQGEENDVILLSLVRSNKDEKIGFLKVDNRICVALSRAKHGLYICGNMDTLVKNSDTWKQIEKKLKDRKEVGPSLTLKCQIHDSINEVTNKDDFKNVPEGGCTANCEKMLNCGHRCRSICHIIDQEHKEYKCRIRCENTCPNNHQCVALCFQKCPVCKIKIKKTLPCTHEVIDYCHKTEKDIECRQLVEKTLRCGHKETMACFVNVDNYKCRVKVMKKLNCGHEKEEECFVDAGELTCRVNVEKILLCGHKTQAPCYIDPEVIKCTTEVDKSFPDCGHTIKIKCSLKKEGKCNQPCSIRLECGHSCRYNCHLDEDPEHLNYRCEKICGRSCPEGHSCTGKHKCYTSCRPCLKLTEKTLKCGHKATVKCLIDISDHKCNLPCQKELQCGHICTKRCGQECGGCETKVEKFCPESNCRHNQLINCSDFPSKRLCNFPVTPRVLSLCKHNVKVPCRIADQITSAQCLEFCEEPCNKIFENCKHKCKGSCKDCLQGRLHLKCKEKCEKILMCGHLCTHPCSYVCPPCTQKCLFQCVHSKCGKKCGEPCVPCSEKCTWRCQHKSCSKLCKEICERTPCNEPCNKTLECGHKCPGLCEEPCLNLCRVCNKEELTEIFFGNEDEEDAKFIMLEDCKHIFEVAGLDTYLGQDAVEGQITAKECPKCKTLIQQSRRYGNFIKERQDDILKVKNKIFGNYSEIERLQTELIRKLNHNLAWDTYFPKIKLFVLEALQLSYTDVNNVNRVVKTLTKNKKIAKVNFSSYKFIADRVEESMKKIVENELRADLHNNLHGRYKELLGTIMNRLIPFTKNELEDFELEFDRLYDLGQIYLRRTSPKFGTGIPRPNYDKLLLLINSPERYEKNSNLRRSILSELKALDESMRSGLGITDRERKEILRAMDMQSGKWFKCPNGHIYAIGDCGGAMVEAKCSECGAIIGGGNHTLRRDNALASEMDGARAPLWPTMLNR